MRSASPAAASCVPIASSSRHKACPVSLSLLSEDDGLAACRHQQISDSMGDSAWLLFLARLPSPDPHASGIRVPHCHWCAAAVQQLCATDEIKQAVTARSDIPSPNVHHLPAGFVSLSGSLVPPKPYPPPPAFRPLPP